MRFRRGKSSSKAKKGSAAAAPWQNGERKVVVDGAGAGSNSRQVAPDTGFGDVDDEVAETCASSFIRWRGRKKKKGLRKFVRNYLPCSCS